MVEVVLVLLTVIAVAAAAAMAPGRLRARAARRRRPGAPGRARPAKANFLAVCASCLEMVETDRPVSRCPACGGELAVQRRIRSADRRPGARAVR